jgi:hypothetical protein
MSEDLFTDSQLFDSQDSDTEEMNEDQNEEIHRLSQLSVNNENLEINGRNSNSINNINNRSGETLLKKNLIPEEDKRKLFDNYYNCYKKTKEAENTSDICKSTAILSEQIDIQNNYFKNGGVNENMPIDAKCILTNSAISLQLVKRLQTDSKKFDSIEFAEKLMTALNPFHRIDRNDDESDNHLDISANDWIEFGRKYCRFHKVLPTFQFIHGSFDSTQDEVQPKQTKPRVRSQKPILSNVTEATQIDPKSKADDESTPQEVEHILSTIKRLEEKNKCSLPYIPIIVNPKSMSQTVENIFHSTFLVKDGIARIVEDEEDGGPTLQTITDSQNNVLNEDKGIQSVFSFTMNDWKHWIKKFDIKKAAIKHLDK